MSGTNISVKPKHCTTPEEVQDPTQRSPFSDVAPLSPVSHVAIPEHEAASLMQITATSPQFTTMPATRGKPGRLTKAHETLLNSIKPHLVYLLERTHQQLKAGLAFVTQVAEAERLKTAILESFTEEKYNRLFDMDPFRLRGKIVKYAEDLEAIDPPEYTRIIECAKTGRPFEATNAQ